MKFFKAVAALLLSFSVITATGCKMATPDAGEEAVLVKKPWFFGHGGVDSDPVKTGMTFLAMSTQSVYVTMQPIQKEVKADDLMTSDGVPLSFDAIIRIQVTDSVGIITRFGENWYENNIQKEFTNRIRQAVRKHGLNETAISSTAIADIDNEVATGMEGYLKQLNMPVKLIAVTVGRAIPPDSIRNQRIETAAQQQRIITEGQVKLAEDARKAAEQSRAEADNAYRNAMSLSPEQFIQLQEIGMRRDVCSHGAKCMFIDNSSKSQPIVDAR